MYLHFKDGMNPDLYAHLVPEFNTQSCQTLFTFKAILKGLDYICIEWCRMFCGVRRGHQGIKVREQVLCFNWMTWYWLGIGADLERIMKVRHNYLLLPLYPISKQFKELPRCLALFLFFLFIFFLHSYIPVVFNAPLLTCPRLFPFDRRRNLDSNWFSCHLR